MQWNVPNILTSFRIVLIPVFLAVFYMPIPYATFWAAVIFVLAAITDGLDGYIARKLDQHTQFGAFLDPVADKIMVAAALVVVVEYHNSLWVTIPSLIIISRELAISALREWMAEIGKRDIVAVSSLGKIKTTAQMIALTALLWDAPLVLWDVQIIKFIGVVALYVAAIFTFWSMVQYMVQAWKALTGAK
ncbi:MULTISPECIES: CDP-diacylglycerol--glycerol-3-phosphate 3-phosphatidyltransferase [Gammaproteobacteria]|uniref:CDP-diacylglycerol--glycerol-3-phosphate 3-phosphatidyltransferase n=1 Tax=Gammaproteobacteria TaxID=1236 RepID=UPI000DD03D74|nr:MULTISPECIES: CDP-diacylglycerol--glycerol-3-phosphate 3-phosphatidyltransferase [Gammaproteobacteria]RTE87191.1 CDP-diacylglycerol--glycerol-3-phosphate 3-phosphatidyltransferase [Aliidiomarina sp. B3213]TCZ93021.1 CDP-diacylglycerol--glycerol-3-phosphate 3-phosphatidyltransferase [Lysobacter sp. N42]